MAHIFKFDKASKVIWPNMCAVCCDGKSELSAAKTESSLFTDSQPLILMGVIKYKNLYLSYPVCHKHRRVSSDIKIVQIIIFFISVFGLLGMASSVPSSLAALGFFSAIPICGVAIYLLNIRLPIRANSPDKGPLVIKIFNDNFAKEFERINRGALDAYAELLARGLR
jgi:hypothetical protein